MHQDVDSLVKIGIPVHTASIHLIQTIL